MKNAGGSVISVTCPHMKQAFHISVDSVKKFQLDDICPKPDLRAYYIPHWGLDLEFKYDVKTPAPEVAGSIMKSKSFNAVMVSTPSGEVNEVVLEVIIIFNILSNFLRLLPLKT